MHSFKAYSILGSLIEYFCTKLKKNSMWLIEVGTSHFINIIVIVLIFLTWKYFGVYFIACGLCLPNFGKKFFFRSQ